MNSSDLAGVVSRVSAGEKLIVVSNREPYVHERVEDEIRVVRPASGMVTALEPIVRAVGGTWVAFGGGSADRLVVGLPFPPTTPNSLSKGSGSAGRRKKGFTRDCPTRLSGPSATSYTGVPSSLEATGRPIRR